jgi:hypothetical protein
MMPTNWNSFQRPLFNLIRMESQRNPNIHNRLDVNQTQDIKLYKKSWSDHGKKHLTQTAFLSRYLELEE